MRHIDWYFDFISPFAYLASQSLHRLPDDVVIHPRPILFAGLLKHWSTRGPAEIEPMREFTFRHITWLAKQHGIPLTLPPAHPFNPLKLLRLCTALGGDSACVDRLFRFVWAEGRSSENAADWQELGAALAIDDIDATCSATDVKEALVQATNDAIANGVFGVPTFAVDGELFWGFDAIDFLDHFLANPGMLAEPEMRAVSAMPVGISRRS